jgi:D-3-phosphoglycerate dehydrogenase
MQVFAYDPYIDQRIITDAGCTPLTDFREVLAQIDVLTVHCPLTPETRGIIGQDELDALKPGGLVINTARGGIVDESALVRALRSGALAGAGFDVFACEPAPPQPDHALFEFDNVIVSPHCAGVSREASVRVAEHAARNVLDCFDGKLDPGAVINPEVLG